MSQTCLHLESMCLQNSSNINNPNDYDIRKNVIKAISQLTIFLEIHIILLS